MSDAILEKVVDVATGAVAAGVTPVSGVRVVREYMESLIIALVLAFFFKAFAAEAYVIPTGSMATTLMGRHKDVNCEMCGYQFPFSASEESEDLTGTIYYDYDGKPLPSPRVVAGTCPQCRHTMYVGQDNVDQKTYLTFNGDRIFVNKSQFDFNKPSRWHVTVFRYPAKPQINYIKRLIGLENETVRIEHGDIFVKRTGEEKFEIQRKPLPQLLAMMRIVDDNDYVMPEILQAGWTPRWNDKSDGNWQLSADYKSFSISADAAKSTKTDSPEFAQRKQNHLPNANKADEVDGKESWLEYSNIVPTSDDWFYLKQRRLPPVFEGSSNLQLVTDFVGYNTGIVKRPDRSGAMRLEPEISTQLMTRSWINDGEPQKEYFCKKTANGLGMNWVGDLAASLKLNVKKTEGNFVLLLVKGGINFRCNIDLTNGAATISIDGQDEFFEPVTAQTPIRKAGSYDVMFCNIDEELRLIVDGNEIDFGKKNRYDKCCDAEGVLNRNRPPTERDLRPVRIGAKNAALDIRQIRVWRDMYYIACDEINRSHCDLLESPLHFVHDISPNGSYSNDDIEKAVNWFFSHKEYWRTLGRTRRVEFKLDKNQFLMLGDNSAKSKDSRLWTEDRIPHYVDRNMLIGEALYVYWPHGLQVGKTHFAIIPNFKKMRRIY
ncbi:MAG: S26 family signal peptidase [Planctomycetaceae bacterium]|jgi:signal peptidase I|nr:S26 family signal peptidase [Planctomycetaceae bacterium]